MRVHASGSADLSGTATTLLPQAAPHVFIMLSRAVFVIAAAGLVLAMDMGGDDPAVEHIEVDTAHARAHTAHFLAAVLFQILVPSVGAAFAAAGAYGRAAMAAYVAGGFTVADRLVLLFGDPKGHENRTLVGTGWFLVIMYGALAFFGLVLAGAQFWEHRLPPSLTLSRTAVTRATRTLFVVVTLAGWIKVCLAVVAMLGFCYGLHTGQCIAHGIMGTSFIAYGFVLVMVLLVPWMRDPELVGLPPARYAQEYYDLWVIFVWGVVNLLTEHRWGKEPWNHGDMQHTLMGLLWIGLGALGILLTRKGLRLFIPALTLVFTGYAMMEHAQHLVISTKVHGFFGQVLIAAGACRIVEISFVLGDKRASSAGILSFQYLPLLLLVESGLLFMGANEEQLVLVKQIGADHSSYILTITCAAGLVFLWYLGLLELYNRNADAGGYAGVGHRVGTGDVEDFELDEFSGDEDAVPART